MRDFQLPGRSPVLASNGMCATSHPLAAKVGVEMMERGGNAVDAAIAAAVLLGFAEPQMTGLGGDCFVLIRPAGGAGIVALNGSGRAPAGLSAGRLRESGQVAVPARGPEAVTVPTAVAAFCALSERYGRLGLDAVLAPSIRYAEEGLPVAPRTAFDWARSGDLLQGDARRFYLAGGRPLRTGQVFRAPEQAEVLRRIAHDGPAGFYEGEVAEDMVSSLRALGGPHTLDDFAAAQASWGEPIAAPYRGAELIEHPPNGAGATALLLAGILAQFDLAALDPLGPERIHLEAEAVKLAYDARNRFIADADHATRIGHMTDPATAAALARLIDPGRAMPDPHAASEAVHRETVYVTAVDRDRMMVSLIYSIYHDFGAGLASSKYGILFHNRGAGFTLERGHPNELGPGKRPMHTILPAMLRQEGEVTMSFGVMGGAYQPAGHVRVLGNLLDYEMDPQTALDAPRAFFDAGLLNVERGYPDAVRQRLAAMGHRVAIPEKPIGGAQAIRIDPVSGVLEGASDSRKDGCALGY